MSESNNRVKEPNTVHHLMSRIAHKVYFLVDDARDDFVDIMLRTADFCGIKLLGWCVMTNHFHILAYLPEPAVVDDEELLRRYRRLKGNAAVLPSEPSERDAIRRRMYDIGIFMKILKQWFTEEYNRRNGHTGTMWEAVYVDRVVELRASEMAKRLGYIHLNPIRAAAAAGFADYIWSSFSAAKKGDRVAIDGLKFIYGEEMPLDAVFASHEALLDALLENVKRERALEIARKMSEGYELPRDPTTEEAKVIQEAQRLRRMAHDIENEKVVSGRGTRERRKCELETLVMKVLAMNPMLNAAAVAAQVGVSAPSVYRILSELQRKGWIYRKNRNERWEICSDILRKQV